MSAYYYDCEFLEGKQKERFPISLFRKETPPTIDLISIGIVSEDGREYYAISKDFNLKEAWNRYDVNIVDVGQKKYRQKVYWIRENVLKPIWRELFFQADDCSGLSNKQTEAFHKGVFAGEYDQYFSFKSLKFLIERYGKTNKQIAEEVQLFVKTAVFVPDENGRFTIVTDESMKYNKVNLEWEKPILYGYYSAYDHVVFCWIFGKMIELPNGFPMYTRDLKQEWDNFSESGRIVKLSDGEYHSSNVKHSSADYPKQENEHSAIHDARWNKKLHEFLKSL